MRMFRFILLSGVFLGVALIQAWAGSSASLFDKPLHETHTPLPPDPDNPQTKPMLSCFYYPDFMVKQVDLGEKGAEQLSILYRNKDSAEPPCLRANAKDETVIGPKAWSGYFEGVKGRFVFFTDSDGFNSGLGFVVFDSVEVRMIFEDSVRFKNFIFTFKVIEEMSDSKNDSDSIIKLRYQKVYDTQCSLRLDEKSCWNRTKQITGLTEIAPPNCTAAYEAEKKRFPKDAAQIDTFSSVITYEVEVVLSLRNSVVRATPISKALECYLGD